MARIRTIKPEFFTHEGLFELEQEARLPIRLSFAGLFTCCDRDGRFRWRPRILKLDILPYDSTDFSTVLDALEANGFVERYEMDGQIYGRIPSWPKHQVINNREMASVIPPAPSENLPVVEAKSGFVYLALSPGLNRFKVGYAEYDPVRRVHDLSCGSAEELELIEAIPGSIKLEVQIHKALKPFSHRREWFECSTDASRVLIAWFTRAERVSDAALGEGKGKGREKEEEGNRTSAPSKPGAPASPTFISIPLVRKGKVHQVTEAEVEELSQLFPAVDVRQALREILAWNNTNPTKRKTDSGVRDHIRRWLAKIQNEGGNRGTSKGSAGSDGTRGAAVGRVERGQNAFRQAAVASVEAAGGFPVGSDDSGVPIPGAPPGHGADVSARGGDVGGGVRNSSSANGAGVISHTPEILPPSQRNQGGPGSHGSQRTL